MFLALALSVLPGAARAHGGAYLGGEDLQTHDLWQAWTFDPLMIGLIAFVLWVYARGALRRRGAALQVTGWRHGVFVLGVGLIGVALLSPIDPMAERLFLMHQVQHMLLRVTAPLLILLAAPQGVMMAGLPRILRKWGIAAMARSPSWRWLGRACTRPVAAFVIFTASLYLWQIPALHQAALLNDALHYLMHVTMLAAGLLFFWVILDARDAPKGISYGQREVMLVGAILSDIALGSATTLKITVWYPAYDLHGRLFDILPMTDETTGGFLIWSPSSMMFLAAILIVMSRWNRAEVRHWDRRMTQGTGAWGGSNSAALAWPETAEELWMMVEEPNRRVGRALGLAAFAIFALVVGITVTISAVDHPPAYAAHGPVPQVH